MAIFKSLLMAGISHQIPADHLCKVQIKATECSWKAAWYVAHTFNIKLSTPKTSQTTPLQAKVTGTVEKHDDGLMNKRSAKTIFIAHIFLFRLKQRTGDWRGSEAVKSTLCSARDQSWFREFTGWLTTAFSSSSQQSNVLFEFCGPHRDIYMHTQRHTHIYIELHVVLIPSPHC